MTFQLNKMQTIDRLLSVYNFKEESLLKQFVWKKTQFEKERYTLKEIVEILKNIIRKGELFDFSNPSMIIIKGSELEIVLKMGSFHICQVTGIILMHLVMIERKFNELNVSKNITIKSNEVKSEDTFYIEINLYNILDGYFELRKLSHKVKKLLNIHFLYCYLFHSCLE